MSAPCALCGIPVAPELVGPENPERPCGYCIADRTPRGPTWPPTADPAGPSSAAARAIAALHAISDTPDPAHRLADSALVRFLHEAGFGAVADAYAEAEKRTSRGGEWWYS